jgi:hypothetical protein
MPRKEVSRKDGEGMNMERGWGSSGHRKKELNNCPKFCVYFAKRNRPNGEELPKLCLHGRGLKP